MELVVLRFLRVAVLVRLSNDAFDNCERHRVWNLIDDEVERLESTWSFLP